MKLLRFLFGLTAALLLFFLLRINFFGPPPALKQFKTAASQNIKNLSHKQKLSYQKLFDNYGDVLIYYLIASEPPYKLELASAEILKSHYKHIKQNHWHLKSKYGLNFFLAYVAKITVTDELITPYREFFTAYNLCQLNEITDKEEKIRELNLWCRQHVAFRPTSGRHQTPWDILKKSNLGRCEEILILFISAARAVGIPARPAYTPLWAHTDGNHAWVEVFVNGSWKYLGAGEPEYFLNQGWFKRDIDKMLLVLARSFYPGSFEQKLFKRGLNYIVNSSPNYAGPAKDNLRNITFKVYEQDFQPAKNSQIILSVFNRQMIRPFLRLNTKESNQASLDLGAGSFFASAYNDAGYDLIQVPYGSQDKVVNLVLGSQIESGKYQLRYLEERAIDSEDEIPNQWQERVDKAQNKYNQIVKAYQEKPLDFKEPSPFLGELWQSFRNNKQTFKKFYLKHKPKDEFLEYLGLIDEKFLWQSDLKQLGNLYQLFLDLQEYNLDYPQEMIAVILEPGVFLEELSRQPLSREFAGWRGKEPAEAVLAINQKLKDKYRINQEKAVYGLLPVDRMVDREFLTLSQYKILLCAVLRHNFIPAAFSQRPNSVFVYVNQKIKIFDFLAKRFLDAPGVESQESVAEASLEFVDRWGLPLAISENQFSFTTLEGGEFHIYPLDYQFQENMLNFSLPQDTIYFQLGYRVSDEITEFQLLELNPKPKEKIKKTIFLDSYPVRWQKLPEFLEPLKEVTYAYQLNFKQDKVFLFGNYGLEPVQRQALRAVEAAGDKKFYWLGAQSYSDAYPYYQVCDGYADFLEKQNLAKDVIITLYYDSQTKGWSYRQGAWETLPQ